MHVEAGFLRARRKGEAGLVADGRALPVPRSCYRNLSPDNLYIDNSGFVQLMDFRFAVKLDGAQARDYCGLATYLAPEQA